MAPRLGERSAGPRSLQRLHLCTSRPRLALASVPTSLQVLSLTTSAQDLSNPFVEAFVLLDEQLKCTLSSGKRDYEPLVLGPLLDRGRLDGDGGSQLQPDNLIITKTKLGYQTQTYLEHQRRCKRLASALQQRGIQLEDRVGTLLWNTAWHMECYHAIPCMGAVLHTLNLRLGPADLGYIIQHANDRMIICDFDLLKLLAQVEPSMLQGVELLICVGEDGVANEWELPTGADGAGWKS
eukprot:g16943.t1